MSTRRLAIRTKAMAYLEMSRPYTLLHAGTMALAAGLVASAGHVGLGRAILIWLTPTIGWLAGLAASDYHDRDLDRIEKPHRPIPSGRVGVREAFWLMVGLIAAGFVGALLLGWRTFLLAWIVMVLGIAYARTFKAKGALGHGDRGLLAALTVIFGSLAATGTVPAQVWPLVALFFFHDSATNLLGAVRDVDGDRAAGYQTLPVRYGVPAALAIASVLIASWSAIAIGYGILVQWTWLFAVLLAATISLDVAAVGQIAYQLAGTAGATALPGAPSAGRVAALRAHKVLVLERLILSDAFMATVLTPLLALGILAALALASWWSQVRLRDRYEFAPVGTASPVRGKEESHGQAGTTARTA